MTDKNTLLQKAKEEIAEGNMEIALELVEVFLKNKPIYKPLHTESLHLLAIFNQTKLDQAKRAISFENAELSYGQVRKGLFNLLDFIENDNYNPNGFAAAKPPWQPAFKNNKWLIVIGLPMLLLSVAIFLLVKKIGANGNIPPPVSSDKECAVSFKDTTSTNFLIIPFFKPSGGEFKPEGLVIDRLSAFCSGIESLKNSEFDICDSFTPDRTLSFEEAAKKGQNNKATIVIWGLVDGKGTTTVIKTRFKYLGNKDIDGKVPFLQLKQSGALKDQGEQEVVTEKVLSIIASAGELTQDLETTLKLMLGMIAQLEGDREGAITAMQSADVSGDSSANLLKYMVLADNFIAMNQPELAKAALDTCLIANENYWLGRSNRANLRIKSGDFLGAIDDLNLALVKRPDDPEILLARGVAFKNSQQLYAAKQDFEKVITMKPAQEPAIRETLKATEIEIKRLEKIVEPTRVKMNTNQVSKKEFVAAADASNQLGNTKVTKQLVAKGLEFDRNNPELIAIQIDNLLKDKDMVKAKEVLNDATKRNVKKESISRYNKNVAAFIKEMQ